MNSLPDENSSRLVRLRPAQHRIFSAAYRAKENYFFEWCVWVGYAVYGLAFPLPWALLGMLGQAIIFASIFGVTGIPPTEAQALRSKGDAYRRYQETTSAFVPLPRRKR